MNQPPVAHTPWLGIAVYAVEPGTPVTNDRGVTMIVQPGLAVVRGGEAFMTQRDWDLLKNQLPEKPQ